MRFPLQRICLKTLLVFVRMEEIFKPSLGFDQEKCLVMPLEELLV
jgi:hypothetical protein